MANNGDEPVLSTVQKLMAQQEQREKQIELSKEEMAEFRKVANSVLASKNGVYFWRKLRKMMGITQPSTNFNVQPMAIRQAYGNLNLWVEGILDPDVRIKLNEEE